MQATFGLPERRAALKRFRRASATFDGADAVHSEARARMLARLPLFKLNPSCVLDLGAATGKASVDLAGMYPDARILATDLCRQMIERAAARCEQLRRVVAINGDAEKLPFADASIDLIFANLLLPWCDPREVFAETARVLRDGGLLLFTTVGPDTLQEIRLAWSEVDDGVHVHGFADMHDLGDLASRAGLGEPVMDVDRLQVTYTDFTTLVTDLRACGATNVAHGRNTGLTGRSRWQAFCDRLESQRTADRLSVSVELIFGQAWGGVSSRGRAPEGGSGPIGISVEELTRDLRNRG